MLQSPPGTALGAVPSMLIFLLELAQALSHLYLLKAVFCISPRCTDNLLSGRRGPPGKSVLASDRP